MLGQWRISAKPSNLTCQTPIPIAKEATTKRIYKTTKELLKITTKPSESTPTTLKFILAGVSVNKNLDTTKKRLKTSANF